MSNLFKDGKRGENAELQEELYSSDKIRKRDAVKRVIRDMTLGKDVSGLFTAVVNCMMTPHLEVRKLVYLYLINYAKTQPDLAIMAVNGFVKDCGDPNPLIRALAVRTMGCIRVDKISEYLCEPLRRALKDSDPYVRKTAAICVPKLYEVSPDLVEDQGFIDYLVELMSDSNPSVVSNSLAALNEISVSTKNVPHQLDSSSAHKLLAALPECNEWGQVTILDSIANYKPESAEQAEKIVERVRPRLQHANSAVVLSASKIIILYASFISDADKTRMYLKALAPPLVTMMSGQPEIQYVALRNMQLICQKYPDTLKNEAKVFFVKYNDPIYVKMEKLDVLVMLAHAGNVDEVLMEFNEYATEVDIEFVRKAVRSIGRCAIKLEEAAERCVNVLVALIKTKVNYVVQEAIVVIRNIFRKYPNKYEGVIGTLCENLDTLDESEAKAAMIWIVGEYAERIDNAVELMDQFSEQFHDDGAQVQLQILTGVVKLFLKRPKESGALVKRVLALATQEMDNPDVRDRGFIYWRLLSASPEKAQQIVLAQRPTIVDDTNRTEPALLADLISNLASLTSVYHRRPHTFVDRRRTKAPIEAVERDDDGAQLPQHNPATVVNMLDLDDDAPAPNVAGATPQAAAAAAAATHSGGGASNNLEDLLGFSTSSAPGPATVPAASGGGGSLLDLLGGGGGGGGGGGEGGGGGALHQQVSQHGAPGGGAAAGVGSASTTSAGYGIVLDAAQGGGLEIRGRLVQHAGRVSYDMHLTNRGGGALSGFAIQVNKNSFALAIGHQLSLDPLSPGASVAATLPLSIDQSRLEVKQGPTAGLLLQVAVKHSGGVFYYTDTVNLPAVLDKTWNMSQQDYLSQWKALPAVPQAVAAIGGFPTHSSSDVSSSLVSAGMCLVAQRTTQPGTEALYMSGKAISGEVFLMELQVNAQGARLAARSPNQNLATNVPATIQEHLKTALAPPPSTSTVPAASVANDDPLAGLF